jgi:pyruvate dehydrogenase E1 component beta subunit
LVVAIEGPKTAGVTAEIAATVAEDGFDLLDAPVRRVASLDTPVPLALVAEQYVVPSEADVRLAIDDVLGLAEPMESPPI